MSEYESISFYSDKFMRYGEEDEAESAEYR